MYNVLNRAVCHPSYLAISQVGQLPVPIGKKASPLQGDLTPSTSLGPCTLSPSSGILTHPAACQSVLSSSPSSPA